ncbi:hypothetical protein LIER_00893 [Lithospermum erythrorhizon]|uniref:Uncharacterized protein n=1 Tax=Lithospermum erythrorhizon TaxID=34254 RepID=A0AAV3NIX5_LITER
MVEFTIVDMNEGAHNGIIDKPALAQFEAVVSLIHLKMKFPTRHGTGEIQGIQKKARLSYLASTKSIKAQMEVGSLLKWPEEPRDRNVCTLRVLEVRRKVPIRDYHMRRLGVCPLMRGMRPRFSRTLRPWGQSTSLTAPGSCAQTSPASTRPVQRIVILFLTLIGWWIEAHGTR